MKSSRYPFLALLFAIIAGMPIAVPAQTHGAIDARADAIYDALGRTEGIRRIVDDLLILVLEDERIKSTFDDVEIVPLKKKLVDQLCKLAGGPCEYRGKDMKTIHEDLAITNAQFNALAEDLQLAMERNGIPSRIQNKLIAKLAPMQRDIVTK